MTHQHPKKPFTPTTLKSLHQQTNSPIHKLLQKLYINFVLTSEIIDHTIPKSITFDQEGFWVGNRDIIDFDRYAFLRFEGDRAFCVDAKEEFWHRKSEANHQLYYSPTKGGWFALLDNPKIENIDLDELYFNKTKREAYNIRYISIDPTEKEPCFRPKRRNLNIEELKKRGELFGVKYRYNQIEGLVCYLDTKGNLRLVDAPRDRQIEELSSLGLKLKKRSLILYTNTNKKATKNDIRDFKIKIDIFPQLKNIRDLNTKRNHVIMVDLEDNKFANTYGKILYRFRNSIAHAEFEIEENEMSFSNTNHDKILFKARIEHEKMERFMQRLLEGVLG